MTYTYTLLEVSAAAYDEIAAKLRDAGYMHALNEESGEIDMHGIALTRAAQAGATTANSGCMCSCHSVGGRVYACSKCSCYGVSTPSVAVEDQYDDVVDV